MEERKGIVIYKNIVPHSLLGIKTMGILQKGEMTILQIIVDL
jgi:hypothetical protein